MTAIVVILVVSAVMIGYVLVEMRLNLRPCPECGFKVSMDGPTEECPKCGALIQAKETSRIAK
jgi:hypothetical protein